MESVAKRATSKVEQRIRGGSEMNQETDEMISRWLGTKQSEFFNRHWAWLIIARFGQVKGMCNESEHLVDPGQCILY